MQQAVGLIIFLFVLICGSIQSFAADVVVSDNQERQDCFVGYHLDWTGVKNTTQLLNIQSRCGFHNLQSKSPALILEQHSQLGLGSPSGIWGPPDKFYIRFRSNCDKKEEMAQAFIDACRSNGSDLPQITRIPDFTYSDMSDNTSGKFLLKGCEALTWDYNNPNPDSETKTKLLVCRGAIEATKALMIKHEEANLYNVNFKDAAAVVVAYIKAHPTADYTSSIFNALREKWPPSRRLGSGKEPCSRD